MNKQVKTGTLRRALILERGAKCECCGLEIWNNKSIPLEVHHKDGNHFNNDKDNLLLLCPNCHAQTENYCGRNINTNKKQVTDEKFIAALKETNSIRQALIFLGLTPSGANYDRAYRLLETNK